MPAIEVLSSITMNNIKIEQIAIKIAKISTLVIEDIQKYLNIVPINNSNNKVLPLLSQSFTHG